ncbi:hypothetical protein HPMG_01570 [Helicobacter pullorum MIT 98-5489]|uniref:Uncharacterized protein n=1 Tax=Helicobacter pullorum MIT 98-5489 TaxID=537972 RepID=C5F1G1_9HELI|nr:hypothetical protein HPMG_01570 [Helicobacter pullorum MIT 98-5489]
MNRLNLPCKMQNYKNPQKYPYKHKFFKIAISFHKPIDLE